MAILLVRTAGGNRTLHVHGERTLRACLDATDQRVRTGCNGNGSCGLCRVRILAGEVSPPTAQESLHLSGSLLSAGVRLACQAEPRGDVQVEILSPAPFSPWRPMPADALRSPIPPSGAPDARIPPGRLGVALDVGTTNLCLTVWGEIPPRRLAGRRRPNGQSRFGADVVTRLQAAARSEEAARELPRTIEHAVLDALQDVATSEGLDPARVATITAVGNAAMLALLEGGDGGPLESTGRVVPARRNPGTRVRWGASAGVDVPVDLVAPLAGFVGSDLLAAVQAAGLTKRDSPALLVDFGTNSEIALWDGATLWVTSAAGGPAFEQSGVGCGVPAEAGAVYRVREGGESPAFDVIDDAEPEGVCASGLVDWIACLLRAGVLSARGTFRRNGSEAGVRLGGRAGGIALDKGDVDLFQRAKGAIGAGIRLLARRAGLEPADLRRVVTTGSFGRYLDAASARTVGLLPEVPPERVETYDNLALSGCEALLLSPSRRRALGALRGLARPLNLAQCPDFEDLFLESLFLAPMGGS